MAKKDRDNQECQENIDFRAEQAAAMQRAAKIFDERGEHDKAAATRDQVNNMLDGISFYVGRREN
jgi:hypothetical protein